MHLCLFDIDGTLIHTGGAGKAALFEALRTAFGIAEPVGSLDIDLFDSHGIDDLPEHRRRFHDEYLQHLPACMSARRGRVLPGVTHLLARLRDRSDIRLALLTGNTRAGAEIKLRHFGLRDFFDFGTGGFGDEHLDRDDVARAAIFELSDRGNFESKNCRVWVIGDTPADVRCARAIGATALAVATGDSPAEELAAASPDHLVADLSDVERVCLLFS
jgi:phosphoglycolate phosphatase-like HAD superfamily hydrolase